jgi:polyisoprenyl-phosphate glycosyltransferase
VQLIMIGIMGEYIGKVLSEIKARPVYFVAEHSVRTAQGLTDQVVTDHARSDAPARTAAE